MFQLRRKTPLSEPHEYSLTYRCHEFEVLAEDVAGVRLLAEMVATLNAHFEDDGRPFEQTPDPSPPPAVQDTPLPILPAEIPPVAVKVTEVKFVADSVIAALGGPAAAAEVIRTCIKHSPGFSALEAYLREFVRNGVFLTEHLQEFCSKYFEIEKPAPKTVQTYPTCNGCLPELLIAMEEQCNTWETGDEWNCPKCSTAYVCITDSVAHSRLWVPLVRRMADIKLRDGLACKICAAKPDDGGTMTHGKGCYHLSAEGGGTEYFEEADFINQYRTSLARSMLGRKVLKTG